MMRSMYSGVSGLRVHQTKMDVIANNISNVNTIGYKSSRVTFNEVFAQTLSSASGASPLTERGGTNPMQIGLGANVASIDLLMTQGAAQRTDNPYDVMIQGDGFFVVSDSSGTYYTRAGAFRLDEKGNLTMPNGMLINGWNINPDPNKPGQFITDTSAVKGIQISGQKLNSPPEMTTAVTYEGNMNALADGTTGIQNKISFFDSLGNSYSIDVLYKYVEDDSTTPSTKFWTTQFGNYMYVNGDTKNGIYIGDAASRAAGDLGKQPVGVAPTAPIIPPATPDPVLGEWVGNLTITPKAQPDPDNPIPFSFGEATPMRLTFNDLGYVNSNIDATGGKELGTLTGFAITINDTDQVLSPKSKFEVVRVGLKELTQFDKTTDAMAVTADGAKAGDLIEVAIQPDGKVIGRYSNGKTKELAQVVLARFSNAAGLQKTGNNLYTATMNSGQANVGEATAGGGSLIGGALEMANVDLSSEFTEMITTQRGFQANSRVITTSDDMLQELVNLKR